MGSAREPIDADQGFDRLPACTCPSCRRRPPRRLRVAHTWLHYQVCTYVPRSQPSQAPPGLPRGRLACLTSYRLQSPPTPSALAQLLRSGQPPEPSTSTTAAASSSQPASQDALHPATHLPLSLYNSSASNAPGPSSPQASQPAVASTSGRESWWPWGWGGRARQQRQPPQQQQPQQPEGVTPLSRYRAMSSIPMTAGPLPHHQREAYTRSDPSGGPQPGESQAQPPPHTPAGGTQGEREAAPLERGGSAPGVA